MNSNERILQAELNEKVISVNDKGKTSQESNFRTNTERNIPWKEKVLYDVCF